MTDAELSDWWPALGVVVVDLRRVGQAGIADELVAAVRAASASAEILGDVGTILKRHRAVRRGLPAPTRTQWDAVMADVNRAYPLARLREWCARLGERFGARRRDA